MYATNIISFLTLDINIEAQLNFSSPKHIFDHSIYVFTVLFYNFFHVVFAEQNVHCSNSDNIYFRAT